ncbi:hypothetical protein C8T65DRAFT_652603, partial [Cerioporus squamosus]
AVGALSAAGRHLFAVGGTFGDKTMNDLTRMRDSEGRAPVKVVEAYPEDHPLGLCALVEVQVPDEELMYACARCGRWETQLGPRFLRCSGCKSRYYCSAKVSVCVQSVSPHLLLRATCHLCPGERVCAVHRFGEPSWTLIFDLTTALSARKTIGSRHITAASATC